jgi:hypothetical protein
VGRTCALRTTTWWVPTRLLAPLRRSFVHRTKSPVVSVHGILYAASCMRHAASNYLHHAPP